jgi:hypothetical protein
MGHPDGQLCDQNFEIFAENISCLRAASGRWGIVVWTVARPLQVISLLRHRASEPWGWPSGRLIFYTQFPYLLYARPNHGKPASGRLSLNCELALRSSSSGRYDTSSGRLGPMNRWASRRDDTSAGRLARNRNLWLANNAESSEALLNSGIPIKKHLYI